ncbi:MAG: Parallel beta-helix repeat [Pedosphaera sp.]|nr:Parallel beta-helix repeat [Pedosphaera sp.]
MNTKYTKSSFSRAALLGFLLGTLNAQLPMHAQGPLTPPGAPTSSMKSLDQIEARTIVNAANTPGDATNTFIISAPGSYYLTGNLTGDSGKHGISIQANDVTLDLNGFALIGGGGGAFRGVNVPLAQKNFSIRNGTVRGWTDGGVRTDVAINTLAEKLRLSDNLGATGLVIGNGAARDCVSAGNATGFVVGNGAQIKDCSATANTTGFSAGDRSHVNNCIATINTSTGFSCTSFVTLVDCTSSRNAGVGISVQGNCNVTRCNASRNDVDGLTTGPGCTVAGCTAGNNGYNGISVDTGSTVQNCTARVNGSAGVGCSASCQLLGNTCDANNRGVYTSGNGNRIDGNSCSANTLHGYSISGSNNLLVRNSAHANTTDFSIGANPAGPIVNMTGGGTISSTSPWANFTY